ncbi:MAG: hypothetical protein ACTSYJ_06210 [Candidatus Thorarchaeota archaeon]
MSSSDPYAEATSSRRQRITQYYGKKMERFSREKDSTPINWDRSSSSMKGAMAKFGNDLDVPFKSIAMFAGSWMLLEIGWPLLLLWGIASAGSVWNIPTTIPFAFVLTYGLVLVSGANMIRSLVTQLAGKRDNIVKALFRGYFWGLLSVGLVFLVHAYFHSHMQLLFLIPIFYLIPVSILGVTVPVPIPLGITGWYMDRIAIIIIYVVGVTGSCIGGIEILKHFMDNSAQRGTYGAILAVLLLAVFPAMNIYFSSVFLTTILELFWRFLDIGV